MCLMFCIPLLPFSHIISSATVWVSLSLYLILISFFLFCYLSRIDTDHVHFSNRQILLLSYLFVCFLVFVYLHLFLFYFIFLLPLLLFYSCASIARAIMRFCSFEFNCFTSWARSALEKWTSSHCYWRWFCYCCCCVLTCAGQIPFTVMERKKKNEEERKKKWEKYVICIMLHFSSYTELFIHTHIWCDWWLMSVMPVANEPCVCVRITKPVD